MVFRSHNSTLCTSTHSTTSLAIHSSCCTKSNWLYELLFLLQTLSLNCPALRLGGLGQNRLPGWSVGFWKEENEERIEKGKVIETNTWLIAKLLALLWVLGHTMHFTCSNLKLSNDMHKREKSSKLLVVKTDSVGDTFPSTQTWLFLIPKTTLWRNWISSPESWENSGQSGCFLPFTICITCRTFRRMMVRWWKLGLALCSHWITL